MVRAAASERASARCSCDPPRSAHLERRFPGLHLPVCRLVFLFSSRGRAGGWLGSRWHVLFFYLPGVHVGCAARFLFVFFIWGLSRKKACVRSARVRWTWALCCVDGRARATLRRSGNTCVCAVRVCVHEPVAFPVSSTGGAEWNIGQARAPVFLCFPMPLQLGENYFVGVTSLELGCWTCSALYGDGAWVAVELADVVHLATAKRKRSDPDRSSSNHTPLPCKTRAARSLL